MEGTHRTGRLQQKSHPHHSSGQQHRTLLPLPHLQTIIYLPTQQRIPAGHPRCISHELGRGPARPVPLTDHPWDSPGSGHFQEGHTLLLQRRRTKLDRALQLRRPELGDGGVAHPHSVSSRLEELLLGSGIPRSRWQSTIHTQSLSPPASRISLTTRGRNTTSLASRVA